MKKVLIGLAVLLAMTSVFAFSNKTEFNTWVSTYQGTTPQFVELARTACLNAQGLPANTVTSFSASKNTSVPYYLSGGSATWYVGCNLRTSLYKEVCFNGSCYLKKYGVYGSNAWSIPYLNIVAQPLEYQGLYYKSGLTSTFPTS